MPQQTSRVPDELATRVSSKLKSKYPVELIITPTDELTTNIPGEQISKVPDELTIPASDELATEILAYQRVKLLSNY